MRTRLLAAAATAAALLTLDVSAISSAAAATGSGHARYVVLTGDDDFLIYAAAVSSHALHPGTLPGGADLYALGRTGQPIHLGKALVGPQIVSLSRSNVVVVNPFKHHHRVRSWNLDTGHHEAIGTNEDVVGATPNGWIAEDPGFTDGTHVVARTNSGDLVDYGTPLTPGVDYGITVGPNGFVAYANNFVNDNGETTYTRWAHPKTHRTLLAPGGKNVRCDSVSASYAGCVIRGGINRSVALIALGGSHQTTAGNRCAYQVAVWGTRLAWSDAVAHHGCEIGHIGATTLAGESKLSKQRFNIQGMTTAWDRVVTSTSGQRGLVTLSRIRAESKPLTRANGD